jgi:hypothetical protein
MSESSAANAGAESYGVVLSVEMPTGKAILDIFVASELRSTLDAFCFHQGRFK